MPASTPEAQPLETLDEAIAKLGCEETSRNDKPSFPTLRGRASCAIDNNLWTIWLTRKGSKAWDHVRDAGAPSIKGPDWIVVATSGEETAARYAHGRLGGDLKL